MHTTSPTRKVINKLITEARKLRDEQDHIESYKFFDHFIRCLHFDLRQLDAYGKVDLPRYLLTFAPLRNRDN